MKNPFLDRIAVAVAVVGMALMALTLVWKVNPIEGSVTADFLKLTSWGRPLHILLLVTCTPALVVGYLLWSGVFLLTALILRVNPSEHSRWVMACCVIVIVIVQGLLYFGIGKAISLCVRGIRNKWTYGGKGA